MAVLELDSALGRFSEAIGVAIETVQRKLTTDIHTGITRRTPVDTGRARASWQIGTGEPNTTAPAPGTYAEPSTPAFIVDGTSPTFVTSSLEYIEKLENGSSKQALAGMVVITLLEEEAKIEQLLAGLKQ